MLKQNKRHTHTKKKPPIPNILEQAASTPQQQHADKKGEKKLVTDYIQTNQFNFFKLKRKDFQL